MSEIKTSVFAGSNKGQLVYHGSNSIVQSPKILIQGYTKDFGYAFYCTQMFNQAKKWALSKSGQHIINKYLYSPNSELKILQFDTTTEEWLDFLVDCRRDIPHDYDIVEGPMGDDQIWDYVDDFVKGNISRAAFWELAKYKHPTHQLAFCTEQAVQCLEFAGVLYV